MRPKEQVASYGEPSSWKETPGTRLEWQQGKQVPSSPAAAAAGSHPPSTNPQRTAKRLVPWPTSLTAQTAKKWSLSLSSLTETGHGKYRRDKKKRSPWSRYPWETGWSQDTLMGCRDQCTTLWWEAGYVHNHKEFLTCFQRKLQQQWRHLVDVTFQRKSLTDLIGVCRSPTGIFDLMNWKSIAPVPWHFCHNKLPWTGMGVVWVKHRHFLFQVLHPGKVKNKLFWWLVRLVFRLSLQMDNSLPCPHTVTREKV